MFVLHYILSQTEAFFIEILPSRQYNYHMYKKKVKYPFASVSFMKAFAYISSTAVMILAFVLIGYFIGRNWGVLGAGIGVTLGGLLGLASIFNELLHFLKSAGYGKDAEDGEDDAGKGGESEDGGEEGR